MDTQTRIGIGAGAAFALIGIAAAAAASWSLSVLALLCGLIALWGMLPLLRFGLLVDWRTLRLYLPLSEAARKLYSHTRGSVIAEFAERGGDGPAGVLNWYAYWMVQHGVRIYGTHPPSVKWTCPGFVES